MVRSYPIYQFSFNPSQQYPSSRLIPSEDFENSYEQKSKKQKSKKNQSIGPSKSKKQHLEPQKHITKPDSESRDGNSEDFYRNETGKISHSNLAHFLYFQTANKPPTLTIILNHWLKSMTDWKRSSWWSSMWSRRSITKCVKSESKPHTFSYTINYLWYL